MDFELVETKNNKHRKKARNIIVMIISALIVILVLLYLFGGYNVPYNDMHDGIKAVERNGHWEFDFYITDTGKISFNGGGLTAPVIYDYENGIRYHYAIMKIQVQRYNVWLNKGIITRQDFMLDSEGSEIHSGKANFDPSIDYHTNSGQLDIRYIRVYYENPDCTYVLIWELPEANEIEERTGYKLNEPGGYNVSEN